VGTQLIEMHQLGGLYALQDKALIRVQVPALGMVHTHAFVNCINGRLE
jgi:hypothetical protein